MATTPYAAVGQLCAFVANQTDGTVTVIDTATNAVTTTIPVGAAPTGIAAGDFGGAEGVIYVTNQDDGTVTRIAGSMLSEPRTAQVAAAPESIAVLPSGLKAYISHPDAGTVSVFDTTSLEVTQSITVGGTPHGIAVSADGSRVYAADSANDQLTVIDSTTDAVVDHFFTGAGPVDAVSLTDAIYVSSNPIAAIDPSNGQPTRREDLPAQTLRWGHLAVTTDQRYAVVCLSRESGGGLYRISVDPTEVPRALFIPLGADVDPVDIAPLPQSTVVYVTDHLGDRVLIVDLMSQEIVNTIPVGHQPQGIVVAGGADGCLPPPTVTPTPPAGVCPGDCNGDGEVSINELILGVNIALNSVDVSACAAFDADQDGGVAINELVAAVNAALNGCPAG